MVFNGDWPKVFYQRSGFKRPITEQTARFSHEFIKNLWRFVNALQEKFYHQVETRKGTYINQTGHNQA
jgi:hypothetical protein